MEEGVNVLLLEGKNNFLDLCIFDSNIVFIKIVYVPENGRPTFELIFFFFFLMDRLPKFRLKYVITTLLNIHMGK